jgi:hypothetical protein
MNTTPSDCGCMAAAKCAVVGGGGYLGENNWSVGANPQVNEKFGIRT